MWLKFFLALFIYLTLISSTINNIEYNNPDIIKLRKEITKNLIKVKKGDIIKIKWYYYKIKNTDNFFKIMARTMLDHDTLATINQLSSLWDIGVGDIWLIPNARGVALNKEEAKNKPRAIPIPGKSNLFFIPGYERTKNEQRYLTLKTFIFPVNGNITSKFGPRTHPIYGKQHWHKGIDIKVPIGTKVKASAKGKVVFVGNKKSYGKTIILSHKNDRTSLYAHLSKFKVKYGEKTSKGQVIGISGKTGNVTGPHLHFEIRRNGKPIRPDHFMIKL